MSTFLTFHKALRSVASLIRPFTQHGSAARPRKQRVILECEQLAERVVPADCTWRNFAAAGGDWSQIANWAGGVPTMGKTVDIPAGTGPCTVNVDTAAAMSVTVEGELRVSKSLFVKGGSLSNSGVVVITDSSIISPGLLVSNT